MDQCREVKRSLLLTLHGNGTAQKLPVFIMIEFIGGELVPWFHEWSVNGGAEHALVVNNVALDIAISIKNQACRNVSLSKVNKCCILTSQYPR